MKEINEIINIEEEIIKKTLLAKKNQLRDEFALKLAPSVYENTICSNEQLAVIAYQIADALVKESEKYRNGEIKHSNSNK